MSLKRLLLKESLTNQSFECFRGLAVKSVDDIDWDNIGISWTIDEGYAYKRAKEMVEVKSGQSEIDDITTEIVLRTEVNYSDIDWEHTIGEMYGEYWKREYSLVLNTRVKLPKIEVIYDSSEQIELDDFSGNSGSGNYDETMSTWGDHASWHEDLNDIQPHINKYIKFYNGEIDKV